MFKRLFEFDGTASELIWSLTRAAGFARAKAIKILPDHYFRPLVLTFWLRLDAAGPGEITMRKIYLAVAGAAALAGCAGRAPAPVAVVQPTDRFMDCAAILAEVQTNNDKVKQLAADKGLKTTQNVAAGVAGVFIPILWFGMDFQGTADTEISALQSRQQYLSMMADQKRCGVEAEPPPVAAKRQKQHVSHIIKPAPTAPASPATQQE